MSRDPVEIDLWAHLENQRAAEAMARRDEGARAAELSLDERWYQWAVRELDRLIASGGTFDADDLRAVVGDPPDGKHVNGIGGLFLSASKRGRIVMAGYAPSTRPEARGRVLRVWRAA